MTSAAPSLGQQRRYFIGVAVVVAVTAALFAVLLSPGRELVVRQDASAAGLTAAGSVAIVGSAVRTWWSTGRRRRAWALLTTAGVVALLGNAWVAGQGGADPVASPSAVSDVTIAIALLLSIAGLLNFPTERRRGLDLAVMSLDGLIMGCAVLMIASGLVYPQLFDGGQGVEASRFLSAGVIPVLDIVLGTVALILIRRSRGVDRPTLLLLAVGFVLYAMTDLSFAVRVAQGTFAFGSLTDLGWVAGYLALALAASCPTNEEAPASPSAEAAASEVFDTAIVFGVLLVAVLVQFTLADGRGLQGVQAGLWLVLLVCAGLRQTLLTRANIELRGDLEDRVRSQTADLRQLARETEVLLSSVGDGIYGVDLDGSLTFLNPSASETLGLTLEQVGGRSAHDMFHAAAPDGTPFPWENCYIAESIQSGTVVTAEEDVYLRGDGTTFPVEISASPLIDESAGAVIGAVVVFRDVTQRREVDRMKNEFLSVVSHELRTPLTSIRGSLGLLAGGALGELSPRAAAMVDRALGSSERLTRMINDILDLERIESGKQPLHRETQDAAALVRIAVQEMSGLASSTGIDLHAGVSSGRIRAERDRIVQTLTNLIGNAVKFSETGAVVEVDSYALDGEVVFRVRDHGRGIPAERLDRIFERFEQVDSSDSRQKGGTGLGLAISRSIVESHGGRIWAESEVGVGTTVSFSLPAAVSAGSSVVQEQPVA